MVSKRYSTIVLSAAISAVISLPREGFGTEPYGWASVVARNNENFLVGAAVPWPPPRSRLGTPNCPRGERLDRFMRVIIILGIITVMPTKAQFARRKLRSSTQRSLVHQIVESAHDHPTA